jgi:hypothetical protein
MDTYFQTEPVLLIQSHSPVPKMPSAKPGKKEFVSLALIEVISMTKESVPQLVINAQLGMLLAEHA